MKENDGFCNKINGRPEKVKALVYSAFIVVAFSMNYEMVEDAPVDSVSASNLYRMFLKLLYAIQCDNTTITMVIISCCFLHRCISGADNIKTRGGYGNGLDEKLLGALIALTHLFGKSFHEFGSPALLVTGWAQTVKTSIIFVGYLLFYTGVIKAVKRFVKQKQRREPEKTKCGVDNPVKYKLILAVILFMAWGIYIAAYYPGLFMGDTEDIIYMAYNYHCGLADTVELISDEVLLVDHHSVLYTIIVGAFVKLGRALFASENTGVFIYVILQELVTAGVLSHALYKLKKYRVGFKVRMIILLFFCFFPWIPRYAITVTKDTLFADFLLLYLLKILDIVYERADGIRVACKVRLLIYAIMLFLLRKNGLYVVILSLPWLIWFDRRWVKTIIMILFFVLASKLTYSDVILPAAQITDGSIREALSVPLQQTGRYLRYYEDEVTAWEKAAIDAVVPYEIILTGYNPGNADPVKNNWRKEATGTDIKNYLTAWARMFIKHPLTYVAATANNYYAYFYPVVTDLYKAERASEGSIANANRNGYFHFKSADSNVSQMLRQCLRLHDTIWMRIPILNMFCTSALYVWGLVLIWINSIIEKDREVIMAAIPLLILMLTVLSGPMNGADYDRYVYPLAMCVPILAGYRMRRAKDDCVVRM